MVRHWYERTSSAMQWALANDAGHGIESLRDAIAKSGVTLEEYMASARAIVYAQDERVLTTELAKRIVHKVRLHAEDTNGSHES